MRCHPARLQPLTTNRNVHHRRNLCNVVRGTPHIRMINQSNLQRRRPSARRRGAASTCGSCAGSSSPRSSPAAPGGGAFSGAGAVADPHTPSLSVRALSCCPRALLGLATQSLLRVRDPFNLQHPKANCKASKQECVSRYLHAFQKFGAVGWDFENLLWSRWEFPTQSVLRKVADQDSGA